MNKEISKKFKINPAINVRSSVFTNTQPVSMPSAFPTMFEYEQALEESKFSGIGGNAKDYYALTAYASIYAKVSDHLKGIIVAVDQVRAFYLVDVVLSQVAEDALAPKMGEEGIVKFSHTDEAIQKELTQLHKRIGLDQLIENITPDLLAYGEYTLATKIGKSPDAKEDELNKGSKKRVRKGSKKFKSKLKPKGILDVTDIVDQGTVISLTQDGNTEGYLEVTYEGQVQVREVADFVKFQLGGQRVRVDLDQVIPKGIKFNKALQEVLDKIPRFIRVGKSILYPVLSKLKELELLEKLVPASKLNELSQGNLVGMSLPENYDLEMALKAVQRVEGMINKKISVDPTVKEITVEAILSTAGKTRVIPLLGDKGNLQTLDHKSDAPTDLTSDAKELRELILDSVGVPSELIFGSDGDSKGEILKRYAKYLRKLKRVQKAISNGCKQIAFIHLANRGIEFKEEDVNVVFNNNLIEIDNLDSLEFADTTASLLENVRDFFNDMAEEDSPYADMIDLNKVARYINGHLKTVGLADAIVIKEEGGADANKDALDVDGVDSKGQPTRTPEEEPLPDEEDSEDEFKKEKE